MAEPHPGAGTTATAPLTSTGTGATPAAASTPGRGRHSGTGPPDGPTPRRWDGPAAATAELSGPELLEAGGRGSLVVADRAVERIAEAAVGEVPGVIAAEDTAGTIATALGRGYPRVDVSIAGRRAHVRTAIVTRWPRPAAQVAAAVRDHVAERLRTLADLDVDAVDVEVARVERAKTHERKRVQ